MPDTPITNLSIQISSSANKAVQGINRVADATSRLGGSSRGASKELKATADTMAKTGPRVVKSTSDASKWLKRFGKSAEDAGKSAKRGASGISDFLQRLKRVAYYRFIRSLIKSITDGIKEGTENLYKWSSAVNGQFAKSMDRIATSTLYLKNSLGAMIAPIINTLAPVIEWLIDKIVEGINWINKLFAALGGSQTYVVAKKVATTWGEAGDQVASSAKSAADDIKRTLLGFDEINRLEPPNSGSSGGSSGSSKPSVDYSSMFEERKLDGWMSKLASFIDRFNLQIPATFAAILAGWAAVKLAIKGVAALTKGWLKGLLGHKIEVAVSLVRAGWETIKGWAMSFGSAVADVYVSIKTKAIDLWVKFAAAWAQLSPVLKVGIAISITAAALWAAYKIAWALVPDKMLYLETAIKTKASELWESLKLGWGMLGETVLYVKAAISTTAVSLLSNLANAWVALGEKVFYVQAAISTAASALWSSLGNAWVELGSKVLYVSAAIATAASFIWQNLVNAWNSLGEKTLYAAAAISTSANALWRSVRLEWAKLKNKVLNVGAAIYTKAADLWGTLLASWTAISDKVLYVSVALSKTWTSLKQWFSDNGEKISNWALGLGIVTLGIAVAIATPWGTVAAALSTLWANVMGSFGGALSFGVSPVLFTSDPLADKRKLYTPGGKFGSAKGGGGGAERNAGASLGRNDSASAIQAFYVLGDPEEARRQMQQYNAELKAGWDTATATTATSWLLITGSVTLGLAAIDTAIKTKVPEFVNMFKTGWEQIHLAIATGTTPILISVRGSMNNISNIITGKDWNSVGQQIVYGIGDGINSRWDWLNRTVRNLANAMYNSARNALGIHSPSRLFSDGVGRMIDLGLAKGIDDSASTVMRSIDAMNADMYSRMTGSVQMEASTSGAISSAASTVTTTALLDASSSGGAAIDYGMLADTLVTAMKRAGLGAVNLDGRQLAQSINRETQRLGSPAIVF